VFQPTQHPKGGGLATSARSEQAPQLPVFDGKRYVIYGYGVAKFLDYVLCSNT